MEFRCKGKVNSQSYPENATQSLKLSDFQGRILLWRSIDLLLRLKNEDDLYVASVPTLLGCHTQFTDVNELEERTKEAILVCLEVKDKDKADDTAAL